MYRTAWHLPNFPKDVVLKLCLHEEDRKHLCPSLAALDSRGCYLIVVPPSPRPSEKPTPTPSRAAGGDERAGDDRDGKPHLSVVGCDAREPAVTVTVTAAGSVGAHVNGCPPPSAAGSTGRPTNSGTPVPESGAAQSESGTASSAATLLVNPNTSAPTLSLPVVARGPAPVAEPAGAQLPVPISVAPAPGSSAAVAAGEAARAAKALEVKSSNDLVVNTRIGVRERAKKCDWFVRTIDKIEAYAEAPVRMGWCPLRIEALLLFACVCFVSCLLFRFDPGGRRRCTAIVIGSSRIANEPALSPTRHQPGFRILRACTTSHYPILQPPIAFAKKPLASLFSRNTNR